LRAHDARQTAALIASERSALPNDAYPRRFPYITKLTLPPGTVDLALHIPAQEVKLIGTKAMLVARDDLSPLIANLLLEAARELHSEQGYFAGVGEFPNAAPVDLPVSADASRHLRFGPSFLHRYLPFFVATYLERLIFVLVPLLVLVPIANLLPLLFRWRVRPMTRKPAVRICQRKQNHVLGARVDPGRPMVVGGGARRWS